MVPLWSLLPSLMTNQILSIFVGSNKINYFFLLSILLSRNRSLLKFSIVSPLLPVGPLFKLSLLPNLMLMWCTLNFSWPLWKRGLSRSLTTFTKLRLLLSLSKLLVEHSLTMNFSFLFLQVLAPIMSLWSPHLLLDLIPSLLNNFIAISLIMSFISLIKLSPCSLTLLSLPTPLFLVPFFLFLLVVATLALLGVVVVLSPCPSSSPFPPSSHLLCQVYNKLEYLALQYY